MVKYEGGLFGRPFPSPTGMVLFPITTESLDGIMAGLEPTSEDHVLSIGGCGDQAFAILEKAGRVVACDRSEAQAELIRWRKAALEREDYEGFFNPTGADYELFSIAYRIRYFAPERLDRIRRKLAKLEIVARRLEDFAGEGTFTIIYASNAISESYGTVPLEERLLSIASALQKGGLLYVSNSYEIAGLVPDVSKLGLQLVQRLTELARKDKKTIWSPSVYQRV